MLAGMMCIVNLLTPEHLTPIVERIVNKNLEAEVSISRVELSLKGTFPFLHVDVDSVSVLSTELKTAPDSVRSVLPSYSDTLFSLDHLNGGINIISLLRGKIELTDVTLDGPALNVVVAGEGLNNFNIFKTDSSKTEKIEIPPVKLRKFQIVNPKLFRYYNRPSAGYAQVKLTAVELDGIGAPAYKFDIDGNFDTPVLGRFNLSDFPFVIDGTIDWHPDEPSVIGFEDFRIDLAFTESRLTTTIDFSENMTVRNLRYELKPLPLTSLLSTVPDSILRSWQITRPLSTEARIAISATIDKPFDTASDTIPYGKVTVRIPPAWMRYGVDEFREFALDVTTHLHGNNADDILIEIERLYAESAAGNLSLDGAVCNLATDPVFNGNIKSSLELSKLPKIVRERIPGYIRGKIKTSLTAQGSASMFAKSNYHKLRITGDLGVDKIYWVAPDTLHLGYVSSARLRFDTDTRLRQQGKTIDSLLTVDTHIDTAIYLQDQYKLEARDINLDWGSTYDMHTGNKMTVSPFGGKVKIGTFEMVILTDSLTLKSDDIEGMASLSKQSGNNRPRIDLSLDLERTSLGAGDFKFMMSAAHLDTKALELPSKQGRRSIVRDSLRGSRPDLTPDSIYVLAVEHARRSHHRYPRVHPIMTDDDTERIYWGTSKLLRMLLTEWQLEGRLKSSEAMVYTPLLPMRNLISDIDVSFNNDTILFENIRYKGGNSDFTVSGRVSDLRQALTSKDFATPIKINIKTYSDTLDIDQMESKIFAGASYAGRKRRDKFTLNTLNSDADRLDSILGKMVENSPDNVAPLLIPSNIDARFMMKADNIRYKDLGLKDFSGQILIYDGAMNLHGFKARSDVGGVDISALYSAQNPDDIRFAFGLDVKDFRLEGFRRLVPPIDSVVPLLKDIAGVISVNMAATVNLDSKMNFEFPTLNAIVRLTGDSLRLVNDEHFKKIGRWLLFKDHNRNVIKHFSAEMVIENQEMTLYPFMFDFDHFRIGLQGYNDFAMNFNYRISVLKSFIPFRFGINIKGNPHKYKIRFGGPKFNEHEAARRTARADSARIRLVDEIDGVFRRGVRKSGFASLRIGERPSRNNTDISDDEMTAEDSAMYIREGLIAPDSTGIAVSATDKKQKKNDKK